MELLRDMALFVEVAKTKSFRKAAEALDMPISTLSRRISALERNVGLRLFNRTTRRIELTEAGALYFSRCQRLVEEAQIAHEQLQEMAERPTGHLRVAMPPDFGLIALAPLMADFAQCYPELSFELDLTPRHVDLVAENVDVAIRIGKPTESNLIARQIALIPRFFYASPGYLQKHGEPAHPADLSRHECIKRMHFGEIESTWTATLGEETIEVEVHGRFALNSIGGMVRLAGSGLGVAILPDVFTTESVTAGRLVRVLPEWQVALQPVYALIATRLLPAKTRAFIDYISAELSSQLAGQFRA